MAQQRPWRERLRRYRKRGGVLLHRLRRRLARSRKRRPRFFTPAFQAMYLLTAVSGALTWLSWRLMWTLPQAARMNLIADTGVDPESVTVLVSRDAHAIFVGMCVITGLCALCWLIVWLKKL